LHVKGGSLTVEHGSPSTGTGQLNINSESNSQVTFSYDDQGHISFGTATTPATQAGFSEKMRIDSAGRLLVGTTTANAAPLTVAGTTEALGSKFRAVFGNGYIDADSGRVFGGNPAEVQIQTATNNRPAVLSLGGPQGTSEGLGIINFFNSGNGDDHRSRALIAAVQEGSNSNQGAALRFYTAADGGSSPTERFKIDSLGRIDHFSSDGNGYDLHHAETGSTDVAFALKNGATDLDTGTVVFRILADGDLENTNNRYTQISDVKFKENIADASSQWDDLKTIRVVNFNFKEELKWGTQKQIGVVAQEIEAVSPGLVCQRKEENGEEYKSVAYSVLYMKAVKALQEAMERIETLETKVAALEAG